jgi:hypothetical protein
MEIPGCHSSFGQQVPIRSCCIGFSLYGIRPYLVDIGIAESPVSGEFLVGRVEKKANRMTPLECGKNLIARLQIDVSRQRRDSSCS